MVALSNSLPAYPRSSIPDAATLARRSICMSEPRAVSEKTMRQSRAKRPTTVGKQRSDISGRVVAFLRRHHPAKWADSAAAELNVSRSTIMKLEERGSAPSLALFGRMGAVYGPEFIASVFPAWSWLSPIGRAERQARLESEIAEKLEELSALLSPTAAR